MSDRARFTPRPASEIQAWASAAGTPPQFRDARFPVNLVGLGLNNEGLFNAYGTVGHYVSTKLAIPPRVRELLIVRCAVKVGSAYEMWHHEQICRAVGITNADLEILKMVETTAGLSEEDAALVRGCDELLDSAELSEDTFRALSAHFSTSELMEIIAVVGLYYWTAILLRSFKVPIEGSVATAE